MSDWQSSYCGAAKTNPLDCSCECKLLAGHEGNHSCECGKSWNPMEQFMEATSKLKEILPIFRKHFESITEFRHLCKTDQDQLISDLENGSKVIIDSLWNLQYYDAQNQEKKK